DSCFHESIGISVTFKNPPNVRFGICARCAGCAPAGGPEVCYEPAAGDQVTFRVAHFDNCGINADDSYEHNMRIYYISGDNYSSNWWVLDIYGDQQNLNSSEDICGGGT